MSLKKYVIEKKVAHFLTNCFRFTYIYWGNNDIIGMNLIKSKNRKVNKRFVKRKNQIKGMFNPLMVKTSIKMFRAENSISYGIDALIKGSIFIERTGNEMKFWDSVKLMNTTIWIKASGSNPIKIIRENIQWEL